MAITHQSIIVVGLLIATNLSAQSQAVTFTNGTANQQIDVPASVFTEPAREITVEAWIRYVRLPTLGSSATIVRHTDAQNAESYRMWVADTSSSSFIAVQFISGSAFRAALPASTIGVWTHVAATWDGSSGTLFINGIGAATRPTAGGRIATGGSLRIGNGDTANPGAAVWNGDLDEVRIWPVARSQAEIQETMSDSLLVVPNGVTFNFEGDFVDTSQSLVGSAVGGVAFVPGAPTGTFVSSGASAFGSASTGCRGDLLRTTVGSTSRAGNLGFALVCTEGPSLVNGGVLLAVGQPPAPIRFLGIDVLVAGFLPVVPPTMTSSTGTARLPVALAASAQLGTTIHAQFVFIDMACGAAGLVASQGLTFTVQ